MSPDFEEKKVSFQRKDILVSKERIHWNFIIKIVYIYIYFWFFCIPLALFAETSLTGIFSILQCRDDSKEWTC